MKTLRLHVTALLLCAAGTGFAAENTVTVPHVLSRADVRAQVIEARRNGTMIESEADRYIAETYYLTTGRLNKAGSVIATSSTVAPFGTPDEERVPRNKSRGDIARAAQPTEMAGQSQSK